MENYSECWTYPKEKIDEMFENISAGGGGMLVVDATTEDDTTTLNKTAGEIWGAMESGKIVVVKTVTEESDSEFITMNNIHSANQEGGLYSFRDRSTTYKASSSSEYPVFSTPT